MKTNLGRIEKFSNTASFFVVYLLTAGIWLTMIWIGWMAEMGPGSHWSDRDVFQFAVGIFSLWLLLLHSAVFIIGLSIALFLDVLIKKAASVKSFAPNRIFLILMAIPIIFTYRTLSPFTVEPAFQKFISMMHIGRGSP